MSRLTWRIALLTVLQLVDARGLGAAEIVGTPAAGTASRPFAPGDYSGEMGPGSFYRVAAPANWNGELVVMAHGTIDDKAPVAPLPPTYEIPLLAEQLLPLGFGIAYSSLSENGWEIQRGVIETHQLKGLFASHFGQPRLTYLTGHSMGGTVAIMLAERFPGQYDGILTRAGAIAGSLALFDFVDHGRVLFDYFYPGVVSWEATIADFPTVAKAIEYAVLADPSKATELGRVMVQFGFIPNSTVTQLIQQIQRCYSGALNQRSMETSPQVDGRQWFDNTNTIYSGSNDDIALNAGVRRFSADPEARNSLARWYTGTGDLHIPLLALQNAFDISSPLGNQLLPYLTLAAAAGASDLISTRIPPRSAHAFPIPEIVAAIVDLSRWVQTGVKP